MLSPVLQHLVQNGHRAIAAALITFARACFGFSGGCLKSTKSHKNILVGEIPELLHTNGSHKSRYCYLHPEWMVTLPMDNVSPAEGRELPVCRLCAFIRFQGLLLGYAF